MQNQAITVPRQTYSVSEKNVQHWRKQNLQLLEAANSTQEKHFISPSKEI